MNTTNGGSETHQERVEKLGDEVLVIETQQERVEKLADEVLVNDTMIDNRLSEVSTRCSMRFLSQEQLVKLRREASFTKFVFLHIQFLLRNVCRFFQVVVSLTFCKSPDLPNPSTGPRLVPRYPEAICLRWATALVAQADWMKGFDNVILPTDPSTSTIYSDHRNHFAEQILLSAALHSCRTRDRSRESASPGHREDMCPIYLPYHDWSKFPELCRGKFSKQEFLKRACQTGSGLPYRAPHPKAVVKKQGKTYCSYANFASDLRRAREALPADIEARANDFDYQKLEWFTIFVSLESWAPASEDMEATGSSNSDSKSHAALNDAIYSGSGSYGNSTGAGSENDMPIENLRKQLGFSDQSDFSVRRLQFPLLQNISRKTVWGNRNILEVSCHIDNWLALCAGEHTSYMARHVPWAGRNCLLESMRKSDLGCDLPRGDIILNENVELERCNFLCQMAILKPEDAHLEKSVTFLGCSMEMLRSSLAKWTDSVGDVEATIWNPE